MTIGIKKSNTKQLDPKQCFEIYLTVNSVYKVPFVLKNEYGLYNKSTGKPFSHQAIFTNIGSYILQNMTEAKKGMDESWKQAGEILTDEKWYKIVLEKARYLSPKKYKEFLAENSYLTPYLDK